MEPQNKDPKSIHETDVLYQVAKRLTIEDVVVRHTLDTQAAIRLLESWRVEGDEQEQRDTWEFLKHALDEDRSSDRKLFP
jgi:hypothetical protein